MNTLSILLLIYYAMGCVLVIVPDTVANGRCIRTWVFEFEPPIVPNHKSEDENNKNTILFN